MISKDSVIDELLHFDELLHIDELLHLVFYTLFRLNQRDDINVQFNKAKISK